MLHLRSLSLIDSRRVFAPIALALISGAAMLASVACDSNSNGNKTSTPRAIPTIYRRVDVEAKDFSYNPTKITATAGRPFNITLMNSGSSAHTVNVYKDKDFVTPLSPDAHLRVEPGAREGLFMKFDTPGTYYFRCEIHPTQMQGEINAIPER